VSVKSWKESQDAGNAGSVHGKITALVYRHDGLDSPEASDSFVFLKGPGWP
jgi:hypothetical protein